MPQYEVTVNIRGALTYMVEAKDTEEAETKALVRYSRGDEGEQTGSEWEEFHAIKTRRVP